MDSSKDRARNELTPEQKAKVRPAMEQEPKAVELSVEELEERMRPGTIPRDAGRGFRSRRLASRPDSRFT